MSQTPSEQNNDNEQGANIRRPDPESDSETSSIASSCSSDNSHPQTPIQRRRRRQRRALSEEEHSESEHESVSSDEEDWSPEMDRGAPSAVAEFCSQTPTRVAGSSRGGESVHAAQAQSPIRRPRAFSEAQLSTSASASPGDGVSRWVNRRRVASDTLQSQEQQSPQSVDSRTVADEGPDSEE